MAKLLVSVCALLLCSAIGQSPPDVIDKVVQTIFTSYASNCTTYKYNYGGAIQFDAMYRATDIFSSRRNNYNTTKILDYNSLISPILNDYLFNDTSTPAYKITNGQTISFNESIENAIGDFVGLFPITYLDELLYEYIKNNDKSIFDFNGKYSTQWQLIFTTADYYILQFPRRLTDKYGTISRNDKGAWQNEPGFMYIYFYVHTM